MHKCPNCGFELETPITERQQRALDALRAIERRQGGRYASTEAVAQEMGYSNRWAWQHLHDLEELEVIARPDGPRSGWHAPHVLNFVFPELLVA
jgi:DNA-binding IscR family transcriptional regulator